MSSLQPLREFVSDRLGAVAEEICRHFQDTIGLYEAELRRQRTLLDICLKPRVKLHNFALPQHISTGEGSQVRTTTTHQEGCEAPQMKEELQEFSVGLDGRQLDGKQETDTLAVTPAQEEDENIGTDLNIAQVLSLSLNVMNAQDEEDYDSVINEDAEDIAEQDSSERVVVDGFDILTMSENQSQSSVSVNFVPAKIEMDSEYPNQELSSVNDATNLSATARDSNSGSKPKTEQKAFSCTVCGKTYSARANLRKHKRIHRKEKPFSCRKCGKAYTRNHYLLSHLNSHQKVKPYTCAECGKGFCGRSGLLTHLKAHERKQLSCIVCGKSFCKGHILQKHFRTHKMKPISCTECNKSFSERSALESHTGAHRAGRRLSNRVGTSSEEKSELQYFTNTERRKQEKHLKREDAGVHDPTVMHFSTRAKTKKMRRLKNKKKQKNGQHPDQLGLGLVKLECH